MLQMLGACMLFLGIMGIGYEYVEKEQKIIDTILNDNVPKNLDKFI